MGPGGEGPSRSPPVSPAMFFPDTYYSFAFLNIFKIKWPKSEGKLNFGGRWVWVPSLCIGPPPPPTKTSWLRTW